MKHTQVHMRDVFDKYTSCLLCYIYSFCWEMAIRWKHFFWMRINLTEQLKTEFHWALDLHSGNTAYGSIGLVIAWQLAEHIHKAGTWSVMNIHVLSPPTSSLFDWALNTFSGTEAWHCFCNASQIHIFSNSTNICL